MSLYGSTALVTGATGFLGGELVRRLAGEGVRVRALARHTSDTSYIEDLPHIEIAIGDVTDKRSMFTAAKRCDRIFHAAASLGGSLEEQEAVNVMGTRNVTEAAAAGGVERLVHVSSIAVYGYGVDGAVNEDSDLTETVDPYALTKRSAEDFLRKIAAKRWLSYSIIRPGMIYGPRSNAWTGEMFKLARRNPTVFVGGGKGHAHPIHVEDVVDMCLKLAIHPAADQHAFNCTPDPAPTWREFLGHYSQLAGHNNWLGVPGPLAKVGFDLRAAMADEGTMDKSWGEKVRWMQRQITYKMDKATEKLGWKPHMTLDEGVAGTEIWLREEGLLT